MKRYLLISSWDEVYLKDEITRDHLIKLKDRTYEWIIDLQEKKWFDVKSNTWKEIKETNEY